MLTDFNRLHEESELAVLCGNGASNVALAW